MAWQPLYARITLNASLQSYVNAVFLLGFKMPSNNTLTVIFVPFNQLKFNITKLVFLIGTSCFKKLCKTIEMT